MGNGSVKSSYRKDDFRRTVSISIAAAAAGVSFYYPEYGVPAVCVILSLCLATLNEIWQRAEGIRFMMELKLDHEGAFGPNPRSLSEE